METIVNTVLESIHTLYDSKRCIRVAIDGRCAAGKSTLALHLKQMIDCNLFHMDDFFLQPSQRTKERLERPGENVDYERFICEVIKPLEQAKPFFYRPYSCHNQMLGKPVYIVPNTLTIVEGSYSCHPSLWDFYDLHIFLTVKPKEQLRRVMKRNGESIAEVFKNKWIPLEELYFNTYKVQKKSELCFDTSKGKCE